MERQSVAAALAGLLVSGAVHASDSMMEELTIVGSTEDARALAGTGSVITPQQIRIEATGDINQLLKTVPGVYIMEEDGYGLRPNIGIRGAVSERSSRITLMEDGVLIAPAPYSNPAAYYFPTTLRMNSIDVLKGAPLLRYGPQTTGGVVNLVSTPIPETSAGSLDMSYGQNNELNMLANYGARRGNLGFLLETAQRRSDGYKDIDRSSADTGFKIQDYVAKLGWEGERQSVLLKAQYSKERSDETYLGLTDDDFGRDADRRYGLSSIDNMKNDHEGYNATYRLALSNNVSMTTTAYYNRFTRDWFKLAGGAGLVDAANEGDANAEGILAGTVNAFGLDYKHNNRKYESYGLDLNFDIDLGNHQLAIGARPHEDKMDRFQPVDIYDQIDGELFYVSTVRPGGSDNRKESAKALSLWAVDAWQVNERLLLNLALRYEDVQSQRKQYVDPQRQVLDSKRSNNSDEWLPGASFTYDLTTNWQLLAGVHRGFSPLGGGANENEDPETSTNWEAGFRYLGSWFVEAVGFYSDFNDKAELCSNASPCSNGETSGSFTTGKADIRGLELQVGSSMQLGSFVVPVELMYTYTDATISEDNLVTGVSDGDRLAAVPDNIFSLRLGLEAANGWDNYAVMKYTDEMCTRVGCNNMGSEFDRTEDLFVLDYISRYAVSQTAVVYLKVENLFDQQSIVSRQPEGARPNKPRTASVGVQWNF